jgi:hypothetical protein
MWQGQPCEACGWLVGRETLPRAPVVKGNRGINAQAGGLRPITMLFSFCILCAVFLVIGLSLLLHKDKLFLLEIPLIVGVIIYAIVSTVQINKQTKR